MGVENSETRTSPRKGSVQHHRQRAQQLPELAMAIGNSMAVVRRDAPSSTASSTRSRKSDEQDFGMAHPLKAESPPRLYLSAGHGNPRFNSDGNRSRPRIGNTPA